MSTPDIIKESIAPLVQRILSDPLHFKSAKHPDLVTHTPSSYVKIGQISSKDTHGSATDREYSHISSTVQEQGKTQKEMAKTRPLSLAQAIAGYTGKRLLDDSTINKKEKKSRKLNQKNELVNSFNDEDLGEDLETVSPESGSEEIEEEVQASASGVDGEEEEDEEESSSDSNNTPENTEDQTFQQESSSSDDDTNYTDAEGSDHFVSETPRNIISTKVYKKYQQPAKSSSEDADDSDTSKNESEDGESVLNSRIAEVGDDEDEEDDDYVDATAQSDEDEDDDEEEDEESDKDEEASDDASSSQEDDTAAIKRDLLAEKAEAAATTGTNTPPTSPESESEDSDDAKIKGLSGMDVTDFYGIEESPADRGSNGSKRLVKNWGAQFSTQKPLGLLNHGVTCYTNAAVQAMIHIPAVQHYLVDVLQGKYKDTINPRSVTQVLAETSARMWGLEKMVHKKGGPKFINPKKLIGRLDDINCMMSEWQQEDSHEYFMSLLSRLQEDSTPKGHKLNESIIYDIFGGSLDQLVTCKNCGHVSKTQQEFYDLSLHLGTSRKNSQTEPIDKEELQSAIQQQQSLDEAESKHRFSINKSIRDFFSPELIKTDRSDKSGYVCEKCKKRTNAIKRSTIDRAPETLAVHLKRFRFNGNSSSKVKQGVSYPLILDLSQYTTRHEPVLYQLISVVVHEGRSVSSGHYVSHCRQPDGVWATYDDEYINIIPEKQALRDPSAYYLIYTRLTHKDVKQGSDVVKKATNMKPTPVPSSKAPTPKSSQPPKSLSPTTKKMKSLRAGIITPSVPDPSLVQKSPQAPTSRKQKFKGLKPTNNLGNLGGKQQKRYAKDSSGNASKRFRKY